MKAYTFATAAGAPNINTVAGRRWAAGIGYRINAPVPARETLLAEMLRTGRAFYKKTARGVEPTEQITRANAFAKAKAKMVGKLLGVEIEYYPTAGSRPIARNTLMRVVSDASLGFGGAEINKVTWQSASGRLEGLLALNLNGRVDKKCGLHVHVDARHLGQDGLLTVEETYKKVVVVASRFMKRLVPDSRRKNRYCKFTSNLVGGDRYAAVNFKSYAEHGTIEFRLGAGSTNVRKIEAWALVCQAVLNWCAVPTNVVPARWHDFLKMIPARLQKWVMLRDVQLNSPRVEGDLADSATEAD